MGCVSLLGHDLSIPYNYYPQDKFCCVDMCFEESWVCQQTFVYTERKCSSDPGIRQEHFKMRCNQALSNGKSHLGLFCLPMFS